MGIYSDDHIVNTVKDTPDQTYQQIADKLGITYNSLKNVLQRNGYRRNKPARQYQDNGYNWHEMSDEARINAINEASASETMGQFSYRLGCCPKTVYGFLANHDMAWGRNHAEYSDLVNRCLRAM